MRIQLKNKTKQNKIQPWGTAVCGHLKPAVGSGGWSRRGRSPSVITLSGTGRESLLFLIGNWRRFGKLESIAALTLVPQNSPSALVLLDVREALCGAPGHYFLFRGVGDSDDIHHRSTYSIAWGCGLIQNQVPVRAATAGEGVEAWARVCGGLAKVDGMCLKKRESKVGSEVRSTPGQGGWRPIGAEAPLTGQKLLPLT